MLNHGGVPAGSVLPFFFATYGKTNGESITLTGLATTDIQVYKGTSMTQRASVVGFTLLDGDGIDVDSNTGIHGFSIDTGDNTDAGFYAAGSYYTVVVASVTVDGQAVNFVAGTFRLMAAEDTAGYAKVTVKSGTGTGELSLASGGVLISAAGSVALTEGYRTDGTTGTLAQVLYELLALLGEVNISGTTLTTKKIDGSTTAGTYTLNDASNPTSITRSG